MQVAPLYYFVFHSSCVSWLSAVPALLPLVVHIIVATCPPLSPYAPALFHLLYYFVCVLSLHFLCTCRASHLIYLFTIAIAISVMTWCPKMSMHYYNYNLRVLLLLILAPVACVIDTASPHRKCGVLNINPTHL